MKRPSHFVSLNEGISRGRVEVAKQSSSLSSLPQSQTHESAHTLEGKDGGDDSDEIGLWNVRGNPTPHASPSRNLSPLPPRTDIVLPSKRRRLESNDSSMQEYNSTCYSGVTSISHS